MRRKAGIFGPNLPPPPARVSGDWWVSDVGPSAASGCWVLGSWGRGPPKWFWGMGHFRRRSASGTPISVTRSPFGR